MANLTPTPGWDSVFQLETDTPVLGGAGGVANSQAQALLNRFAFLEGATGSSKVGHTPSGTGAVATTVESKLRESVSVLDFGADPTGVADSTTAFNNAIATGKRVFVSAGTYSVADITVVDGMDIEGEKTLNSSAILLVRTNSSGAFTHSAASDISNIRIANLTIRAAGGVTGARAYKQVDKSVYTAYAIFSGLETWQDLEISFEGFFIFSRWDNCRDGFNGTAPGAQTHQAISSVPAAFGQGKQSNINQVFLCQFFRSTSATGFVDIAYGDRWDIAYCDFENGSTLAINVRGIFGVKVTGCWFESLATTSLIVLETSPAPNPQGVRIFEIDNCQCFANAANTSFVSGTWALSGAYRNITFSNVPVAMVLTTAAEVNQLFGIQVLSGSPTAFTTNTRAIVNGIVRTAELETTVINSPVNANLNTLPIGPSSLGQANFTTIGFVAKADIASPIKGNSVRFQMTGSDNVAYYQIPAKMLDFLKNKTITLTAAGFGDAINPGDLVRITIWDSVTPSAINGAAGVAAFTTNSAALSAASVSYTVPSGSTALYVGITVGGAASGGFIYLETMALFLGQIKAIYSGL